MSSFSLEEIQHYFPLTELPILFSDDHIATFESESDPFPMAFVQKYLHVWENDSDEELTEYIPCAAIPMQETFQGFVYWKAGLLRYDFILVTVNKKGQLLHRKSIASTIIDGRIIKKSIASIDPDMTINIIAGVSDEHGDYDASLSKPYTMEIMPDGEIVLI
jgi:hypothetical protein